MNYLFTFYEEKELPYSQLKHFQFLVNVHSKQKYLKLFKLFLKKGKARTRPKYNNKIGTKTPNKFISFS